MPDAAVITAPDTSALPPAVRIHPDDDVLVALRPLAAGERIRVGAAEVVASQPIEAGHKLALRPIPAGAKVRRYGWPIGHATRDISAGEHVHSHNLATDL
jgi:altronate hydrolase